VVAPQLQNLPPMLVFRNLFFAGLMFVPAHSQATPCANTLAFPTATPAGLVRPAEIWPSRFADSRAGYFGRNGALESEQIGVRYTDPRGEFATRLKIGPRGAGTAFRLLLVARAESELKFSHYYESDRYPGGYEDWESFRAALLRTPRDRQGNYFPRFLVGHRMEVPVSKVGETQFTSRANLEQHARKHLEEFAVAADSPLAWLDPEPRYEALAREFANRQALDCITMSSQTPRGSIVLHKVSLQTGEFLVAAIDRVGTRPKLISYYKIQPRMASRILSDRYFGTLGDVVPAHAFEVSTPFEVLMARVLFAEREADLGRMP